MTQTRVVHVPGRTPYARKLCSDDILVLNETSGAGFPIPRDATLRWLLQHRPWDWLDVVHLHHPDFEPIEHLRAVLEECRRARKRLVFTAHDLVPIFGDRVAHSRRLRLLAEFDVPVVCLTRGAEVAMQQRFTVTTVRTVVIPHGFVAAPGTLPRTQHRERGPTRFLIYGSLRANRDVELVLACWRFAQRLRDTTLRLLLRAPSRVSLVEDASAWRAIRDHAGDPRFRVDVVPHPTDLEVNAAVAASDCVVLPYRWASHSGQLEHAFDLGALPVAARTGHLPDQAALHKCLVPEPEWFDWSDDATFDHGARLLTAMENAHVMIQQNAYLHDPEKFADHRRREHASVLHAHLVLYEGTQ